MTYRDVVDHALDFLGGDSTTETERKARRAVQAAINAFWSKRTWACFYRRGRLVTSPSYATGTVTYLFSSGAIPRQLTLSGGTWPSWAADGQIKIGFVTYTVSGRISDTVLQLQSATAPPADIAATTFIFTQETYRLPVDFGDCGEVYAVGYSRNMTWVTPDEFYRMQRLNISPAFPHSYTIQGDPRRLGSLSMFLYPAPDQIYTLDYSYRRQSRALSMHGASPVVAYTDGKVSIGASSTTLTGSGTSWTPDMAGCVVRFAAQTAGQIPTGQAGESPFYIQRTISSYTDAQTLTVDQVTGAALTNVPYSISDPVDLEAGAMTNYFLREVEKQCRIILRAKPEDFEEKEYAMALRAAFEADGRHHEARSTFSGGGISRVRIASMPSGAAIGG